MTFENIGMIYLKKTPSPSSETEMVTAEGGQVSVPLPILLIDWKVSIAVSFNKKDIAVS